MIGISFIYVKGQNEMELGLY